MPATALPWRRMCRRGAAALRTMVTNMNTVICGALVLPDGILADGAMIVEGELITAVGKRGEIGRNGERIEHDGFVAPGFIDLHVHGGCGADFMDATDDAFKTAVDAHARHGTTSIVPTTTVATHEQILETLGACRRAMKAAQQSARIVGCHFYGPYFGKQAAGCHPAAPLRDPEPSEFEKYLAFGDVIASATVAPELPSAELFANACRDRDILVCVGHSHCTFDQMQSAIGWGARHVDHLYCAMSDRAFLRRSQTYPMRGGLLEATLYSDELSTEIIADGKHLSPELMRFALKIKGVDRLALVTDCSRALDMPDGEYVFGPKDGGEPFIKRDGVGLVPDGQALASSVVGMDHMVRTMHVSAGCPLHVAVRMASLTPARILSRDRLLGSLSPGKLADFVLLDRRLSVQQVWVAGRRADG